jgi:iron uptake system component EfeO
VLRSRPLAPHDLRRGSRHLRAGLALGAALAIVAGCGSGTASPAGTGAAPTSAVPSGTVAVEAREYAFTPSTITVPAGDVTFAVRNGGTEEHEFEIFEGETVVDEIEGLVPGLTKDLTVTLEAGSYQFKCLLNGHDQLGMVGTLTVE